MRLTVTGLAVELDRVPILAGVDAHAEAGELVGVVGPNGSGKSTLLRTVYRALRPVAGTVTVGGTDIWHLTVREAAQRTAAVLQERPESIELTVRELVATGRTPHVGAFARDRPADRAACAAALDLVGMAGAAGRMVDTLSGGERQRVLLARALAQEPRVLVLDEPTNHLDIRFQLELLALVKSLRLTAFVALHDLNLAADFCDRVYVLDRGRVVACGPPAEVFDVDLISRVFGVRPIRLREPGTGRIRLAFDLLEPPPAAGGSVDGAGGSVAGAGVPAAPESGVDDSAVGALT